MKNKTINVNNPTQININANSENSIQTIGRKIKETLPTIVTEVNSFWYRTFKSLIKLCLWLLLLPVVCILVLKLYIEKSYSYSVTEFILDIYHFFIVIWETIVRVDLHIWLALQGVLVAVYAIVVYTAAKHLFPENKEARKATFWTIFSLLSTWTLYRNAKKLGE